ncbi:proteasome accessory factor PafA2 family protein [Mycobacterium tuberculosis]|uniref:proteasome accessory factor PafA2 family protein n=1 Tax=Mycobacterium tuberculosis TaxID=1773 RepID=UPI0034575E50
MPTPEVPGGLHVIVGDSNMSETTTMGQGGGGGSGGNDRGWSRLPCDFSLDNPIRAIREVSHDVTGRRGFWGAVGRRGGQASALDIQGGTTPAQSSEHLQTREGGRGG